MQPHAPRSGLVVPQFPSLRGHRPGGLLRLSAGCPQLWALLLHSFSPPFPPALHFDVRNLLPSAQPLLRKPSSGVLSPACSPLPFASSAATPLLLVGTAEAGEQARDTVTQSAWMVTATASFGMSRWDGASSQMKGTSRAPAVTLQTCVKAPPSRWAAGSSRRAPVTLMAHLARIEPLKARNCKTICLFLVKNAPGSEPSIAAEHWRCRGSGAFLPIQSPFVSGLFI